MRNINPDSLKPGLKKRCSLLNFRHKMKTVTLTSTLFRGCLAPTPSKKIQKGPNPLYVLTALLVGGHTPKGPLCRVSKGCATKSWQNVSVIQTQNSTCMVFVCAYVCGGGSVGVSSIGKL